MHHVAEVVPSCCSWKEGRLVHSHHRVGGILRVYRERVRRLEPSRLVAQRPRHVRQRLHRGFDAPNTPVSNCAVQSHSRSTAPRVRRGRRDNAADVPVEPDQAPIAWIASRILGCDPDPAAHTGQCVARRQNCRTASREQARCLRDGTTPNDAACTVVGGHGGCSLDRRALAPLESVRDRSGRATRPSAPRVPNLSASTFRRRQTPPLQARTLSCDSQRQRLQKIGASSPVADPIAG